MHRPFVPLLRCLPLLLLWALPTFSQPEIDAKADSTTAYASKHYPLLQVPQLLWMGLVYPLGQFTIYAEHTKLPQRVNNGVLTSQSVQRTSLRGERGLP